MKQSIVHVAVVVNDYDEAIEFYTQKLGFELLEDIYIAEQDKRWVLVAPRNSAGAAVLLAKASDQGQQAFAGNQTGGRVFLFLSTDDFWRDYRQMQTNGVNFYQGAHRTALRYGCCI